MSIPPVAAPSFQPPRLSKLAVASLILGLLGFLFVPAVAGLACGIIALVRISRSSGALRGHGLALSGSILSGVFILLTPVMLILASMLLPAMAKAKERAQTIHAMNNAKQVALGLLMYANENSRLPAAETWTDAIETALPGGVSALRDPRDPAGRPAASVFAFNSNLAGVDVSEADPSTVLLFEVQRPDRNLAGGPELLKQPQHPRDTVIVAFVDGHAEAVNADRLRDLRWKR